MATGRGQIVHFIPGRVRVKIDQLKGNAPLAEDLQRVLSAVDGIHQAKASPFTGSVLICYDPAQPESIDAAVETGKISGVFPDGLDVEPLKDQLRTYNARNGSSSTLGGEIKLLFGNLNTETRRVTRGFASLKDLIPLTLFFLGLRSLLFSGQRLVPSWYDYFWFAFGTFFVLNPTQPSTRAEPGVPSDKGM
ncbi:MAG: hypothetical protein O7B35_11805 [Deltaproteobacteria bacterium]|nr:hypothetical protein [Deltaproteobacteria bacterium]